MDNDAFTLWDDGGRRLYLNAEERAAFRQAAKAQGEREMRTFCHLLAYTGCRISEALETNPQRIDWQEQAIIFRTLKKRGKRAATSYRAVPMPADFLDELDLIHHLRGRDHIPTKQLLWSWHRSTAWRQEQLALRIQIILKGFHGLDLTHH